MSEADADDVMCSTNGIIRLGGDEGLRGRLASTN